MNSNAAPTQTVDAFFQATNGITVNGVQRSPTTPNPAEFELLLCATLHPAVLITENLQFGTKLIMELC